MKKTTALFALLATLLALCGCQNGTPPEVTDTSDTPAVIDTLPPDSDTLPPATTEAPLISETEAPSADTTDSATAAPEDTTVLVEEDPLLKMLLTEWEKSHGNAPEHVYNNVECIIAYKYLSNTQTYSCMLACYNTDGTMNCYPAVYVKNGSMTTAYPAAYYHILNFEEAIKTKIIICTFADQKLLMSVKNNAPNNVESFNLNDFDVKNKIKIIDGVVFNEKATELILFPPGRTGSYTVPDGVTKIADGAFDYSKLSEVILPASVTEIGTAFDKAPNIKIIRADNTTTNISYTKDPTVLSFGEIDGKIVGIINGYDFTIVSGRLSIDVFDSESIGKIIIQTGAFIDSLECVSLYPICGMPESEIENILILQPSLLYQSSNGIVFSKDEKTLVLFPSGRTGSYTVPDGVTKIADGAFDHSKLSEVILPASVTEIGTAFDKAPNIKIVHEESK
ncbi:MAG: leucine-rich repeat protein [Clostridia bacterium]|nr:leucine-rich repeat protein [Clostridia bacterium]